MNEIWIPVIVALISSIPGIYSFYTARKASKKESRITELELAAKIALQVKTDRLSELEKAAAMAIKIAQGQDKKIQDQETRIQHLEKQNEELEGKNDRRREEHYELQKKLEEVTRENISLKKDFETLLEDFRNKIKACEEILKGGWLLYKQLLEKGEEPVYIPPESL